MKINNSRIRPILICFLAAGLMCCARNMSQASGEPIQNVVEESSTQMITEPELSLNEQEVPTIQQPYQQRNATSNANLTDPYQQPPPQAEGIAPVADSQQPNDEDSSAQTENEITEPAVAQSPREESEEDSSPSEGNVASGSEGLQVKRMILSRGIENREPVEEATEFQGEKGLLYAFLDVANNTTEEQQIVVVFRKPDGSTGRQMALNIPPSVSRWRTWARFTVPQENGQWEAVAQKPSGETISQMSFTVNNNSGAEGAEDK